MKTTAGLPDKRSFINRRRKIWSINECHICSVIGACMRRTELRKLAGKKQFGLTRNSSDYQLHSALINLVCTRTSMARTLNKMLDKKFLIPVKRYAKALEDQAILELWNEDVQQGNVSGAYWAIMTHPVVSDELLSEIYGQVHMMGHDSHGDYQRDQRAFAGLREKVAMLEDILSSERRHYLDKKNRFAENLTCLCVIEQKYNALKIENNELNRTKEELELEIADSVLVLKAKNLKQEVKELRQQNASVCGRIDELTIELETKEDMLQAANKITDNFGEINNMLKDEKEELQQEMNSLETALLFKMTESSSCAACEDKNTERCPGVNLFGKTLLYVGGRKGMIPVYKQVVEKFGGRFIYHDGGIENSRAHLPKMLGKADVVLCPVDCVSHDACNRVKKICKRYQKPFVLMRSSGLSSLTRSISEVAQ